MKNEWTNERTRKNQTNLPKPDPGHKVLLSFSIVSLAALVNGVYRKVALSKLGIQKGNPELDFDDGVVDVALVDDVVVVVDAVVVGIEKGISGPIRVDYT